MRFGERLGPWNINRGQVYRTVTTLEREQLIEEVASRENSERSGPTYRLTDAGAASLERWIATPSENVEPLRSALLAKLAVAEPSDAHALLEAIDWYERALATQIAHEARDRSLMPRPVDAWAAEVADRIAEGATLHRDAELVWVRRVREFVKGWADRGAADQRGESLAAAPMRADGRR